MKKLTLILFILLFSQQLFSGTELHDIDSGAIFNEVTLGLELDDKLKKFSPSNLIIRYNGSRDRKAEEFIIPIKYIGDSKKHEENYDELSSSLSSINEDDINNNRLTQFSPKLLKTIVQAAAQFNFKTEHPPSNKSELSIRKSEQSIRNRYYSKLRIDLVQHSQNNKPLKTP